MSLALLWSGCRVEPSGDPVFRWPVRLLDGQLLFGQGLERRPRCGLFDFRVVSSTRQALVFYWVLSELFVAVASFR